METFGEWLKQQRRQRRLTREEFAKRVGCSVSALQKIEYGERRPSAQIAELLANCLDVPLEERSIFVRVARGELSTDRLLSETKPVATPNISPRKIKLPIYPTPLIGRERELEQLSQLLRDPHCRLLTLVGPGGIGKTRLAIEAASQVQDFFAHGVYFVSLAPVNATSFIVPMIADVLGFTFQSQSRTDPKTQLLSYLKEKLVLLLTDNLEHLLSEPGIEVLPELLADAPQVKLLATSRESLRLQDEWVFEVHGLPVPENPQTEGFAQDTSVELFLQRARRAHVEFNAASEDFPVILRICHLVDGIPLAIELAAAWVRALTCAEIAKEIERSLDFLRISARDIPARHRSMRAVFDHSWKLLPEEEKIVLARLSVFRGGFQRQAAEQVAEATLTLLSTLVTKSLVRRSGMERYDLHELIRQFSAERFAERSDEQSTVRAYHGRYYLKYLSQADGRLSSSSQREALAELTTEIDNFRAAWDWAVIHGKFALIEQTMRAFFRLYDTRGWYQEATDLLDNALTALEMTHGQTPTSRTNQVALGHILINRAWLAFRLDKNDLAIRMFERSLDILRPLNEPRVLVEAITYLGLILEITGNYTRALDLYSEGLEMATAIGDRWFAALCLSSLNGMVVTTHRAARPENAHERLQSAVADWRLIGDPRGIAFGLRILSQSAFTLGRYDEARAALEESAALNSSIGFDWGLASAYRGLAIIAQAQGEHLQAINMFRKSLDTFTEVGARQDVARVLAEMSRSIFVLGNDTEAERGWVKALRITSETQSAFVALEALVGIAMLKTRQRNIEQALELSLIVLNHPSSLQETKDRAASLRAELEAQLTPTQIEAIQAHAEERNLEMVIGDLLK